MGINNSYTCDGNFICWPLVEQYISLSHNAIHSAKPSGFLRFMRIYGCIVVNMRKSATIVRNLAVSTKKMVESGQHK